MFAPDEGPTARPSSRATRSTIANPSLVDTETRRLRTSGAKMAGTIQLLQNEATADDGWTQYQQSQGRKFFRGRG